MERKELLVKHLIEYGFFIPSSEIYGGLAGFYDFGPNGVRIKEKFIRLWKEFLAKEENNIFFIDGSVILPYEVLKASGHVDSFTDPIVECKKCGRVFRADKLIEENFGINADGLPREKLEEYIKKLRCPECGGELSNVEYVNLMFKTEVGYRKEKKTAFLRPETAQSIFLDFLRIYKSFHPKFPFGVAQIGKAFRNEISPRKFVTRVREFYQMEIEWFVLRDPNCDPKKVTHCGECKRCPVNNHPRFSEVKDTKIRILTVERQRKGIEEPEEDTIENFIKRKIVNNEHMGYFLARIQQMMEKLIPRENFWFRQIPPEELPHYSVGNFDLEVRTSFGVLEINGNAYRTDHDLKTHSENSGKDLSVEYNGEKVYPNVIEPSFGIERPLFAILDNAFVPKGVDRKYNWLKLHPLISPYTASIHPLVINKEEFIEKAREVYKLLKEHGIDVRLEIVKSIGKAYARMDSIGVPYNITVDYQTFQDNTVTIRFRDTKEQIRVKIEELPKKIRELVKKYPEFY